MLTQLICFVMIAFIGAEMKPLDHIAEYSNEIDDGKQKEHKTIQSEQIENDSDRNVPPALKKTDTDNGLNLVRDLENDKSNNENNTSKEILADEIETSTTNTPTSTNIPTNLLSTIWDSFVHKFNFSPQTFFQDRLGLFKEVLAHYGSLLANNPVKAKQLFDVNGLIQLAGLGDNGFYTNRLQPAGFLGGNGWFANKGGLLGGPGAILSTGPILTDYPTPYKKRK